MRKLLRKLDLFVLFAVCLVLGSCKNFLNGFDFIEELENAIEYTNAPTFTVLIASTDGSGSFLTGNGEKNLKVGDSVEVEFKVNDAWQFQKWIAVDKDNQTKNLTNYINFSDSTSTKTTVTLLAECENILVMPKCVERLKITSYSPDSQNAVPFNSDISINFNYNISQSSVTFTPEELESLGIDDSYELIKIKQPDNSEAVYGYKKNNITYYKNIEITSLTGEKLNGYFNPPQIIGGKTLLITKNNFLFIFDSTKQKTVIVTVASDFSDKTGISIGSKQASFSYTINNVSKIADPTVKIDFIENEEYGTITPNQTTECLLQKDYEISFTESKDYKFVRWEPVYNDGTNDSAKDIIQIKDENSKSTTFQLKYAIPGLAIKAVCEKRPEVKEVYPLNLSSGVLRNTDIKITFSEPIQDLAPEYFDFGSEKCVISLKDASGSSINKNYKTPFVNYDKKTVVIPCNYSNQVNIYTRVIVSIDVSVFKNKSNIAVSDESSLYSWEFTVGDKIENTVPVIKDIKLAATEEKLHSSSIDLFCLPDESYQDFNPRNHSGKTIYGYINTYDSESKAKYLYITETLVKDKKGLPVQSEPYPSEKFELAYLQPDSTEAFFSYTFKPSTEREDGLYKMEFCVEDDFEESMTKKSDVITFYVVKDTVCDISDTIVIKNNVPDKTKRVSPNANGFPTQTDFKSAFYLIEDLQEERKSFEISGLGRENWYSNEEYSYNEKFSTEVYVGTSRSESEPSKQVICQYLGTEEKFTFSLKDVIFDRTKDLFIRVVISDDVGNSNTYDIAYPKEPLINFINSVDSGDGKIAVTPNIIDPETDVLSNANYLFYIRDADCKVEEKPAILSVGSDSSYHYSELYYKPKGNLYSVQAYSANSYDLYFQPVYKYKTGEIYGPFTKVFENYKYSSNNDFNKLDFTVDVKDNKNGTCTIKVKPTTTLESGAKYSLVCMALNTTQQVILEDNTEKTFTFDCTEAFDATITSYVIKGTSAKEYSKKININIDYLPPRRKSIYFIDLVGTEGYVCKVKTPLEDANGNLYDVNKTSFYQDLYYSENGSNFKENGIKITVPVTVSSATEAVYEIDVRNLKYGVQSSNYYRASNYLYIETSDTKNNTYSGVFAGFNCQYCSRPVTLAYDGQTKKLQVTTPNHPNYDDVVSQWGQNSTSAQQHLNQNDVQGYLEFFDSKKNEWIKPEKVKDNNNLKYFVHWNYSNKNPFNDGTPVYDLSDISNYKVIRLISWMSSPYLLPAYNFFGIQTPLKYGTILAGTKDAVLVRESNTEIPTLVYAKYSDFDYGLDINLWEIGGFETATQVVYDSTNLSVSNDSSKFNYVPSGKYYVFIARYADGTTSISNVFKK